MNRTRVLSPGRALLMALVLAVALSGTTVWAQDVMATVGIETAGQSPIAMEYTGTDEGFRIDMAQPQQMSLVWLPGPPPRMLMIQGPGRCMEMGGQAFEMMRRMMQQAPGGPGSASRSTVDVDKLGFEPTGENRTFGPWTAAGVRMTGMEAGQEGTVWIAADLDTGLFELFARMADALEAMPMFGGGPGGPQEFLQYRELQEAAGLPDGGAVRMDMNDPGGATAITLQSLELGSFSLEAPSQCQEMPSLGPPE